MGGGASPGAFEDPDFSEAKVAAETDLQVASGCLSSPGCLLGQAFRNFQPMLEELEEYARRSGCRFLAEDFQVELRGEDSAHQDDAGARKALEARRQADPAQLDKAIAAARAKTIVAKFASRLRAGESALQEELETAFRWTMVESVRNAMIATFQRLELWPPVGVVGVDEDDCAYEDDTAPLPVIAQRLHNDEQRRQLGVVGLAGLCRLRQRAKTASFLVDFAEACGHPLPEMSETLAMMLTEFAHRVVEWERAASSPVMPHPRVCTSRDGELCGTRGWPGLLRELLRLSEAVESSRPHIQPALAGVAAATILGPPVFVLALAGYGLARSMGPSPGHHQTSGTSEGTATASAQPAIAN